MKTTKKFLSVVLAMALLVSTLAFMATTASAADYAFMRHNEDNKQILGAYNYDDSYITPVEDPTLPGTGIRAMRMYKTGKDQYGYIGLATDESVTATEFEWEPNTKYALSFDYLLGANATIASFSIYKGAAPTFSSAVAGKVEVTSYSNGVSLNYKGDGKFHNAVLTFTTPAADAERPHIYLRLNGSSKDASTVVDTYIKNIKLVKYNNLPTAQSEGWEKYFTFDQDGNATPAVNVKDTDGSNVIYNQASAWTSHRYGNDIKNDSYFEYNEDGTLYADTHTDLSYTVGSAIGGMSFTVPKAGDAIAPFLVKEGTTYNISVKFKFTKSPNFNRSPYSKSKIGFAYLVSTDQPGYVYKTVSNAYCVEPINVVTFGDAGYTEADTWYTVSLNNWTAEHTAVLRLFIGGQAGFIIDKVNISSIDDALTSLTVNDNGASSTHVAVKGAKLDGFNAQGVEGKVFDGWYTSATFEEGTEVTTVPNADNAILYAKYIDTTPAVKDYEVVAEGSIRNEGYDAKTGNYVSAGIRFKGRVTSDFRAEATEIGFYAVPTEALSGTTIENYLSTENNIALSAKVKADNMEEIVYEVFTDAYGTKFYDYQLIITGLTREGEAANLLGTDITCVMYAVVDGETVYTNTISYCYNDVANK